MAQNYELIWIVNTRTGKKRQIRRHLWELWRKDANGTTRAEGWTEMPGTVTNGTEEFTASIQQKIANDAAPVQKKSPVVNAEVEKGSAMDMQAAFNELDMNEKPIEVVPVTDEPTETTLPEETELVEVEDKKPAAKRNRRKK